MPNPISTSNCHPALSKVIFAALLSKTHYGYIVLLIQQTSKTTILFFLELQVVDQQPAFFTAQAWWGNSMDGRGVDPVLGIYIHVLLLTIWNVKFTSKIDLFGEISTCHDFNYWCCCWLGGCVYSWCLRFNWCFSKASIIWNLNDPIKIDQNLSSILQAIYGKSAAVHKVRGQLRNKFCDMVKHLLTGLQHPCVLISIQFVASSGSHNARTKLNRKRQQQIYHIEQSTFLCYISFVCGCWNIICMRLYVVGQLTTLSHTEWLHFGDQTPSQFYIH